MFIRIMPGSVIVGTTIKAVATIQVATVKHAVCHRDEESGDFVFEFEHAGNYWTVGHEDVETIDSKGAVLCQN